MCIRDRAAAKTVKVPYWNTQDQQKLVWPATFVLARAYLDQLARTNGLPTDQIASARTTLAKAEKSAKDRKESLTQLASQLTTAASSSSDQAKVKMLASTVTTLANGSASGS